MDFHAQAAAYRRVIEREIVSYIGRRLAKVARPRTALLRREERLAEQAVCAAGKRLRPMLTLAAYEASGGTISKKIFPGAIAFELFHASTLVHDDIYDEDDVRRGAPAVHAAFRSAAPRFPRGATRLFSAKNVRHGIVAGFLNGEYLRALAALAIAETPLGAEERVRGGDILARVVLADAIGQALDLEWETHPPRSVREALRITDLNINPLFAGSAEWGVVLAGGSDAQRAAIRRYAAHLGYAFKMKDDLLDVGVGGDKGRPVGSDIRNGKVTLLYREAFRRASAPERRAMSLVFGNARASVPAIRRAADIVARSPAVAVCRRFAEREIAAAHRALASARPAFRAAPRRFLEGLAQNVFVRVQ